MSSVHGEESRAVTEEYLPDVYLRLRTRFPSVAEALDSLGSAAESAGPLDDRTQRLVKLGIAVGAQAEGAVRSNARKALAAGASEEELLHVVALAINTRGFPAAVAAFTWVEEVLTAE
jgi:4-carboxymuconolactone decarboxylase